MRWCKCRLVEAKVVTGNACPQQQQAPSQQEVPIRVVLPYKDQKAANSVRRQLSDLSRKINTEIRPVYTSRKIKDTIKVKEQKPPIVNQQSAVYYFKCDLCDADYGKGKEPDNIEKNFKILRKCQSKLDCLIFEMLFIRLLKPKLNKQSLAPRKIICLVIFRYF